MLPKIINITAGIINFTIIIIMGMESIGTSLVVQWLIFPLPMQGARFKPGQRARSCMLQLSSHAEAKTSHAEMNVEDPTCCIYDLAAVVVVLTLCEPMDCMVLCPSLSPRVCVNSRPLSWWYHPTISSSVTPFSSCPQSFPASGSWSIGNWLFTSDGQSIRVLAHRLGTTK